MNMPLSSPTSSQRFSLQVTVFLFLLLWAVLTVVGGLLASPAQADQTAVVDRIVAVVNDEIITLFDLNQTLRPYEENIQALGYPDEKAREMLFKLRSDLLSKLINAKIADQQINKNNIKVSNQEIDMAIERMKEARSYTEEDLRAGLAEQGLTMEEYRQNLKQQLLRGKLVNREVKSKIVITNEEIEKYYNAHRDKYAGQTKYHIWNISIRFDPYANDSEKRIAFQKMEAVLTKLKQGRSFESIATETPSAPGEPHGADLGLYQLDDLSTELLAVLKNMKAGEYSSILNADNGYQIVYIEELIATDPKTTSEVKNEIEDILYNEAIDNRYNAWLSELRKKSHIKIIK